MKRVFEFENDEGEIIQVPGKWEICGRCDGYGTHVNPNVDGNGITQDEMEELGPEFKEDYMSGVYDVQCEECHGTGKTFEIDLTRIPEKHKDDVHAYLDAEYEFRAEKAQEERLRRLGIQF
jgi:hypothetical protein